MRCLLLLFLAVLAFFALTCASPLDVHDLQENEFEDFLDDLHFADEIEQKPSLKERFKIFITKLRNAYEKGKTALDVIEKLQGLSKILKDFDIDVADFIQEVLEHVGGNLLEYWNKIKETKKSKRNADVDVFGMIDELKKEIKEHFFPEVLRDFVESIYGKYSEVAEQLSKLLELPDGETRTQRVLKWLDRIFGKKTDDEKVMRGEAVKDKVKKFFKDLNIDLKEKFGKFGEWAKEEYEKGLQKGKNEIDNVKKLAKAFLDEAKSIGKEVAEEAMGFFKDFKEDLGNIYEEIKEKVIEILTQ